MQWGIPQRCRRAWGKDVSGLSRGAALCLSRLCLSRGRRPVPRGGRVHAWLRDDFPPSARNPAAPRCSSLSAVFTEQLFLGCPRRDSPAAVPGSGGAGLLKLKLSFPCPDAADELGSVSQTVDKTVLVLCFSCLSCQKSCAGRFLRVILAQN